MIVSTLRGMFRLLAGLGAGLTIVLVLLAWRLSAGPISLAFLSSYIEGALSAVLADTRVRLDDTILAWAGWERALDIRVLNVRALAADGTVVARFPEVSLSLSAQALAQGLVAPRRIEVFRPSLVLVRDAEGGLTIGLGAERRAAETSVGQIVADALAVEAPAGPLAYLRRLDVVDARVTIEDQTLGLSWEAPSAQLQFRRDGEHLKGEVSLALMLEHEPAHFTVIGDYDAGTRRLDVGVTFSEVNPAVLSRLTPQLKPMRAVDLPMQGTVTASMAGDGAVEAVGFHLTGGGGHLALTVPVAQRLGLLSLAQRLPVQTVEVSGRFEGDIGLVEVTNLFVDLGPEGAVYLPLPADHTMPLRSLRATGRYHGADRRLEIGSLDIDLQGPTLRLDKASIDGLGGAMTVRAAGTLRDVPVDGFDTYWPRGWGADPRTWCLAHLSGGQVSAVRGEAVLRATEGGAFTVESLRGDMDIEDVTVDYLPPMPKATATWGRATFDTKRFDIAIHRSEASGLTVRRGRVLITGLDEYDQFADIDLVIEGPVQAAMGLIDHEPLGFASTLSIDPGATAGSVAVDLHLRMILEHALSLDQVEVSATAELQDAAFTNVVFGQDLSGGRLDLVVDKTALDLTGNAVLGSWPVTLAWRRHFIDDPPYRSRYQLVGRIDGITAAEDLGFELDILPQDFINGSVAGEVKFTLFDDGTSHLDGKADLTEVELSAPALGWRKETGVAGTLSADLRLRGDIITGIPRFDVNAGDLALAGSATYSPAGLGLERIDINHVSYGRTDMKGALIPGQDGGWTASVHGVSFDLAPLWETMVRPVDGTSTADTGKGLRFSLSLDLENVWLGPDRHLEDVVGTLVRDGDLWRTVLLSGRMANGEALAINLEPAGLGKRTLAIHADDAGEALRTFAVYDNMVGGVLDVSGEFDDTVSKRPLAGRVSVSDYRIVDAPALAHVVSIMALTGIVEALQGDGLAFTGLEAPFTWQDGIVTLTDAKATGISLGFTASGEIAVDAETLDLEGTVVPAYAINSILGRIPLVGDIFTGGEEGSGVFAATYTLSGGFEEPDVSVNPLTAFAPGIFRKIFDLFGGDEQAEDGTEPQEKSDGEPSTQEGVEQDRSPTGIPR